MSALDLRYSALVLDTLLLCLLDAFGSVVNSEGPQWKIRLALSGLSTKTDKNLLGILKAYAV